MKKLAIFTTKNQVCFYDGAEGEEIFNLKSYKNLFKKDFSMEHNFFDKIIRDYKMTDIKDIKENFLYLFNLILISNLTNFIVDSYEAGGYEEIIFDELIENSERKSLKFNNLLNMDDLLGGLMISLLNSKDYLDGNMKLGYGKIANKKNIGIEKKKDLNFFLKYQGKNTRNLIDKLTVDLVAFGFVEKDKFNDEGRYSLPIYVDYDLLLKKQLNDYEDFLPNWKSIAYLNMLDKIYDFFARNYGMEAKEEKLVNDDLMIALISLLDYEEKPIPKGLNRSLEVGRQTAGKCFIIEGVERPISLPESLALTLQSKDIFSTVPKICLNSI